MTPATIATRLDGVAGTNAFDTAAISQGGYHHKSIPLTWRDRPLPSPGMPTPTASRSTSGSEEIGAQLAWVRDYL